MDASQRTRIVRLIGFCVCAAAVTALAGVFMRLQIRWLRLTLTTLCNAANGGLALLWLRLSGRKLSLRFGGVRQYAIGVAVAAGLGVTIILLPILCGTSLVGGHRDFVPWSAAFGFFNCFFVIGPVEELMFREYVQGEACELFPKRRWIGVLLAGALFGADHLINGFPAQALFTFAIGCAFGFARAYWKGCTYLSVAFGHGLYDWLCELATYFL